MNDYIVSARKYRPTTFKSVVGQKNLTSTLKNAIDTNRLAQAYLFCGPRGVGKTSCARIFAKTINCTNRTPEGEACGKCESCLSMDRGNSFNVIEMDAASNSSVDNMRSLTEEVNIPPQIGKYRVFIIDEVHMLSNQAFNAFLKTLEEPPKYVIFILATTEKHKIIPTILSRCQIYDFKRITTGDIVEHLQHIAEEEGVAAEPEALNVIARKADGGMRDALSIFDQVAASSMGNVTYASALANLNVLDYEYYFRLVEDFRAGNVAEALLLFNEIQEKGFDILFFINGLASHIRDLMVAADPRTAQLLETAAEIKEKYTAQAQSLPLQWYFAALKLINDADLAYRTATNKQILVELLLIRLCQLLAPPTPPFDRVDNEPPLQMPSPSQVVRASAAPKASTESPKSEKGKGQEEAHAAEKKDAHPVEEKKEMSSTAIKPSMNTSQVKSQTSVQKAPSKTSVRLSDLEAEYDGMAMEKQGRRKPIDDERLNEIWREYIAENGEKSILVSAMKTSFPTRGEDEEYLIKVSHPAQEQAFQTNMNHFLNYFRNKLENDFFSVKVMIDDSVEIKKPMPPKELFQDMVRNNSSLAGLASALDVEII